MTGKRIISGLRFGKRPDYDIPEFRRMCAARQAFIVALHDWLHRADCREGQIEVDGSLCAIQQIAAIVDPSIVPGKAANLP